MRHPSTHGVYVYFSGSDLHCSHYKIGTSSYNNTYNSGKGLIFSFPSPLKRFRRTIRFNNCLVVILIILLSSEPPTMQTLMDLKVHTLVGVKYFDFGIYLLNYETGAATDALELEHSKNAERINQAILKKWLQGMGLKPVNWQTLMSTLQKLLKCISN